MKRDMDLCRELMLAFEALPSGAQPQVLELADEVDANTAMAHIDLLKDAGLIECYCRPDPRSPGGGAFQFHKITWAGFDFLSAAKDDSAWKKTQERLKQAGAWTFALMMEVLKDQAKKQLGSLLP